MKFIGVRDFRTQSARIWQELGDEKDMIITSNGKPIALLSAISEDNLEESLQVIRQSRAIQAIAQLQSKSVELGLDKLTPEEIETEIQAVRAQRSK